MSWWKNIYGICRLLRRVAMLPLPAQTTPAAPSSLCWPCWRVWRGTAACHGHAGTSKDAQGTQTSSWDFLLQSGQPQIVPLQGFAALLGQCSRLQLLLLMILHSCLSTATRAKNHLPRKLQAPALPPQGGTSRRLLQFLPSSFFTRSTTNHRSSVGTLAGVSKEEEPSSRERPGPTPPPLEA